MPNEKIQQAIISRLKSLFDLVLIEAKENPRFLKNLENILLSDEVKLKIKNQKRKASSFSFNILDILRQGGPSALRDNCSNITTDHLRRAIVADKYAKLSDLRKLDRDKLIAILIEGATKRLSQGSVFLKTD
jgi:hypothetical protein